MSCEADRSWGEEATARDWRAEWIWLKRSRMTPNLYVYFRRAFDIPSAARQAALRCTCSSEYRLFVNGTFVGRGPGPCDPKWQYYDTYDVARLLRAGRNAVCVVGYNYAKPLISRPLTPGGFLLDLEVVCSRGQAFRIPTDEKWRVAKAGPWRQDTAQMIWYTGFQEIYDARKEPAGWLEPGFDDSRWSKPLVIGKPPVAPWLSLIPRQIPPLEYRFVRPKSCLEFGQFPKREETTGVDVATLMTREEKQPLSSGSVAGAQALLGAADGLAGVKTGPDGEGVFITLDFGEEVVGYPSIAIADCGGGMIDLGYSESLAERDEGNLPEGYVDPARQMILQADRVILGKRGGKWQSFGRRAFRYMQMSFRDLGSPLLIKSVGLDAVRYTPEMEGSFRCSDDLLNRIWRISRRTLEITMQDQFEDCPLREAAQYVGDAYVGALCNYYLFGDTKLAAKALWQFTQSQRPDGWFKPLYPTSSEEHSIPDYNALWVLMLRDYYMYSGDVELTARLYPALSKLMGWFDSQVGEQGLLVNTPEKKWWVFVDFADLDKEGEVTALNCFYYQALMDAAQIAGDLGYRHDLELFKTRASRVRNAINSHLWDTGKGVYGDTRKHGILSDAVSWHANTLAVLYDIADDMRKEQVVAFLDRDAEAELPATFYFYFYVLRMLCREGRHETALKLLRKHWGYMLDRGATTCWEHLCREGHPLGDLPPGICRHSLCHGFSAAPSYILPAEILGIKPLSPGWREFTIAPCLSGLEWVEARIPTPNGYVDVDCRNVNGKLKLHVDAPKECRRVADSPQSVEGSRE